MDEEFKKSKNIYPIPTISNAKRMQPGQPQTLREKFSNLVCATLLMIFKNGCLNFRVRSPLILILTGVIKAESKKSR